jgi:hypothetical protein
VNGATVNNIAMTLGSTGNLTIAGGLTTNGSTTFNNSLPTCTILPTTPYQLVNKKYADDLITNLGLTPVFSSTYKSTPYGAYALNAGATHCGYYNVAIGYQAGYVMTEPSICNTFVGYQAGLNANANFCNYIGYQSGGGTGPTTGSWNTCVGGLTGLSLTTGDENAFFGMSCGTNITTGRRNTFIGSRAGSDSTITTYNNSTCIGYSSQVTGNNQVVLGTTAETVLCPNVLNVNNSIICSNGSIGIKLTTSNTSIYGYYITDVAGAYTTSTRCFYRLYSDILGWVYSDFNGAGFKWRTCDVAGNSVASTMILSYQGALWIAGSLTQNSDYRIKNKLGNASPVLDRICSLSMFMYELANVGMYKPSGTNIGFYAHDLKEQFPEIDNIVDGEKDAVDEDGKIKTQAVNTFQLTNILMKAIQELNEVVKAQQQQIDYLISK